MDSRGGPRGGEEGAGGGRSYRYRFPARTPWQPWRYKVLSESKCLRRVRKIADDDTVDELIASLDATTTDKESNATAIDT
jgi:hypothetical protein